MFIFQLPATITGRETAISSSCRARAVAAGVILAAMQRRALDRLECALHLAARQIEVSGKLGERRFGSAASRLGHAADRLGQPRQVAASSSASISAS